MKGPQVLFVVGYFDWFSGYQETVLARAAARYADVRVLASDRVGPIFSDRHLKDLGVPRQYKPGTMQEHGITVQRVPCRTFRRMVWSSEAKEVVADGDFDLIVQVMPGQGLPLAASLVKTSARRAVLYGDNSAMWAHLSPRQQRVKSLAFAATRGLSYRYANVRAEDVYGYTPETLHRLRSFARQPMRLLPLAYDERQFGWSEQLRTDTRTSLGFTPDDRVIVSAGKFDRRKRLDVLITAFGRIARSEHRARLLIVGDDNGDHSAELHKRVADQGLQNAVRFEPFVTHDGLNRIFNASDVGVWPAQPAITIQQAMATGLTVAIPRNEWLSHLLDPTTGTYLNGPLSVGSLEDGLSDSLELAATDRASRAIWNARFSGDMVVRSLLRDAGLVDA